MKFFFLFCPSTYEMLLCSTMDAQTLRNADAPSNGASQLSGTVFGIYCLLGNTAAMAAYIVTAHQLQPEYDHDACCCYVLQS